MTTPPTAAPQDGMPDRLYVVKNTIAPEAYGSFVGEAQRETDWDGEEVEYIRADLARETAPTGEEMPEWRCFHCDETFTDPDKAREHFGDDMLENPACKLSQDQRGLVGIIREQKRELDAYGNERDALAMNFYALGAQHETKLREAEQVGYDRGLADGRARPSAQPPAGEDAGEAVQWVEKQIYHARRKVNHNRTVNTGTARRELAQLETVARALRSASSVQGDAEKVALARALVDADKLLCELGCPGIGKQPEIDTAKRIIEESGQ